MAIHDYDFGKASIVDLMHIYDLADKADLNIPGYGGFSTRGLAHFFDILQFRHLSVMSSAERELLSEVYNTIYVKTSRDQTDRKTRLAILEWLQLNDMNGEYTDDRCMAEDLDTFSLSDAVMAMAEHFRDNQ